LFDYCGTKRWQKFLGDVSLDVADQIVDEPGRLLPADPLLLGVALADVSEFGAVER
jgi:hypothetical protein